MGLFEIGALHLCPLVSLAVQVCLCARCQGSVLEYGEKSQERLCKIVQGDMKGILRPEAKKYQH